MNGALWPTGALFAASVIAPIGDEFMMPRRGPPRATKSVTETAQFETSRKRRETAPIGGRQGATSGAAGHATAKAQSVIEGPVGTDASTMSCSCAFAGSSATTRASRTTRMRWAMASSSFRSDETTKIATPERASDSMSA
jgi:hypothetical protein